MYNKPDFTPVSPELSSYHVQYKTPTVMKSQMCIE